MDNNMIRKFGALILFGILGFMIYAGLDTVMTKSLSSSKNARIADDAGIENQNSDGSVDYLTLDSQDVNNVETDPSENIASDEIKTENIEAEKEREKLREERQQTCIGLIEPNLTNLQTKIDSISPAIWQNRIKEKKTYAVTTIILSLALIVFCLALIKNIKLEPRELGNLNIASIKLLIIYRSIFILFMTGFIVCGILLFRHSINNYLNPEYYVIEDIFKTVIK